MNKLIFCVGIPGGGKSHWAETHKDELNAVIHSSDAIREELGDVNDQSQNNLVFETLHKRVKDDLCNGKNVIYDATNLSRKRRISFLHELEKIPCEKICVLFATPWEIALANNFARDRQVPEDVMVRMIKSFEVPSKYEGWDDIQIVWYDYKNISGFEYDFHDDIEKWRSVSHSNPHHSLSIGDHMIVTYNNALAKTDDFLLSLAAYMHDCGKIDVKSFVDSKGNTSEIAHFYSHENVSAYKSLFYLKDLFTSEYMKLSDYEIIYVSLLINLHMRPFVWEQSEKAKEKDRRLFGDDIIHQLEVLHECDVAAK